MVWRIVAIIRIAAVVKEISWLADSMRIRAEVPAVRVLRRTEAVPIRAL